MQRYDYRLIQPHSDKKHNPGHFVIFETKREGQPLAKAYTRDDAELIVKALNGHG